MRYAVFERTESINEQGHLQTYDEEGNKVCSQCSAFGYTNFGAGTMCEACRHDFDMECQNDYA